MDPFGACSDLRGKSGGYVSTLLPLLLRWFSGGTRGHIKMRVLLLLCFPIYTLLSLLQYYPREGKEGEKKIVKLTSMAFSC